MAEGDLSYRKIPEGQYGPGITGRELLREVRARREARLTEQIPRIRATTDLIREKLDEAKRRYDALPSEEKERMEKQFREEWSTERRIERQQEQERALAEERAFDEKYGDVLGPIARADIADGMLTRPHQGWDWPIPKEEVRPLFAQAVVNTLELQPPQERVSWFTGFLSDLDKFRPHGMRLSREEGTQARERLLKFIESMQTPPST